MFRRHVLSFPHEIDDERGVSVRNYCFYLSADFLGSSAKPTFAESHSVLIIAAIKVEGCIAAIHSREGAQNQFNKVCTILYILTFDEKARF